MQILQKIKHTDPLFFNEENNAHDILFPEKEYGKKFNSRTWSDKGIIGF